MNNIFVTFILKVWLAYKFCMWRPLLRISEWFNVCVSGIVAVDFSDTLW